MQVRVIELTKEDFKISQVPIEEIYMTIGKSSPEDVQSYLWTIIQHEMKVYKTLIKDPNARKDYEAVFTTDKDLYDGISFTIDSRSHLLTYNNEYLGHVYTWTRYEDDCTFNNNIKENMTYVQGIRMSVYNYAKKTSGKSIKGTPYYLLDSILKSNEGRKISVIDPLDSMTKILDKFGFIDTGSLWTYNPNICLVPEYKLYV